MMRKNENRADDVPPTRKPIDINGQQLNKRGLGPKMRNRKDSRKMAHNIISPRAAHRPTKPQTPRDRNNARRINGKHDASGLDMT